MLSAIARFGISSAEPEGMVAMGETEGPACPSLAPEAMEERVETVGKAPRSSCQSDSKASLPARPGREVMEERVEPPGGPARPLPVMVATVETEDASRSLPARDAGYGYRGEMAAREAAADVRRLVTPQCREVAGREGRVAT